MARSIRSLGIFGATLAFLVIAGFNFTALNKQWDVPYMGVQKANAWGKCSYGQCAVWSGGHLSFLSGCFRVSVSVTNPCASVCILC